MDANKTITVSALNGYIKAIFDAQPGLNSVSVRGELSNYKLYPSGHHYFTLKDAAASVRCVMFRGSASKLGFKPENGMSVIASGSVSVYERDGAYQLYCRKLTPDGEGDLNARFEALKAKLMAEGLFDEKLKKQPPWMPGRIAVITSPAGAAVRDIIRILGRRWPLSKVIILPVRVQGEEAPAEIVSALRYANSYNVADVIITGRGGGSAEDLWAFNDERVARAIAASEIPVISAVGHEPDVTIADYVADLRAATPSNAAELAVPNAAEVREGLNGLSDRLQRAISKRLADSRSRLAAAQTRPVIKTPGGYIDLKRMELDFKTSALAAAAERYLSGRRETSSRLAATLDALSPLRVLSRGYGMVTGADGTVIKSAGQAVSGDRLTLRLSDGELGVVVE